ncbi:MAG: PDDEXK nuclease domain-containing protein [Pseudomonadota bacterium]
MKKTKNSLVKVSSANTLFDRVVSILEQARANVVRSVNSNMTIAYWYIGQEIVHELQGGKERAEYGKQLVHDLSDKLTRKYGKGFSTTNLWYFRQFYLAFADRSPEILHKPCGEFNPDKKLRKPCGVLDDMSLVVEKSGLIKGFSSLLSWSHYRALTKVENRNERLFYEIEAEKEGWSVPALERQIHSFLFARLLKSRDKDGVMNLIRKGHTITTPTDTIKDPYILDFLGLPDSPKLHEGNMEAAIISNLQSFLLELGKGFAFIGRQKRLQFDDDFFYIDLVFYNCILKCYLLIDLKIGKLTHQDVGQMDSYVRMFDEKFRVNGDNPTIGLILCAKKNETIARYSVLKDSRQLFASRYMLYLPTEEELQREIERERRLIESTSASVPKRVLAKKKTKHKRKTK